MPRSASVSVMASKRAAGPRTTLVTDEQGTRKVHLRRTHKKSHLGCQTCKQRRIKCDEKFPCCSQCQRAKLSCPYEKYTPEQAKEHEYKRQKAAAQAAAAATETIATTPSEHQHSATPPISTHPQAYGYHHRHLENPHLLHPHQQPASAMPVYSQIHHPSSTLAPTASHNIIMPPPPTTSSVLSTSIAASFTPLPPDQMPPHYPRHLSTSAPNTHHSSHTSDIFEMDTSQNTSISSVSSVHQISSSSSSPSLYTQQPKQPPSYHYPESTGRPSVAMSSVPQTPAQSYLPVAATTDTTSNPQYTFDPAQQTYRTNPINSIPPASPQSHFNFYSRGIPNIARISEITDLQRRDLLNTVNLVRQGFETDLMRKAYGNWMSNTLALAFHHECLFHSVMAFSFGFQALKTGNQYYRNLSDKHRVLALKKFDAELEHVSPANTDALLGTSLILYWDAMYQVDTIYSYINMCRGLGAILEKVQINSSTTQTAICTTESLAQAIKSILFPRYPHFFFQELIEKISQLEPLIMSDTADTQKEYYYLRDFTNRVYGFIKYGVHSTQSSIYDPNVLYDFIKEWISDFPCLTFSIDFIKSDACVVLYAFFDAVSHALDAVFPEARYLFQFSFIGPIDLIGIENTALVVSSKDAFRSLEYPLRMVSFFKKRAYQLSGLFMTSDPLLMSPTGVPLYRSRQLDLVLEKPLYSFCDDRLKYGFDEFMPSFNPDVPNIMDSTKTPPCSTSNKGVGFGQQSIVGTTLPPLFASNSNGACAGNTSVGLPNPSSTKGSAASSCSTPGMALSVTPKGPSSISAYSQSPTFSAATTPSAEERIISIANANTNSNLGVIGSLHGGNVGGIDIGHGVVSGNSSIPFSVLSPRTSLPPLSAVLSPKDQSSNSPQSTGSCCDSPLSNSSSGGGGGVSAAGKNSSSSPFSKGAPLPPLSSLSIGSFKRYFDDRLDILRHFAPNQPDIY